MRKTGSEIEQDVYELLSSEMQGFIRGTVYLRGGRPINAKTEDAVISFMTGIDAQMQTGALTINVYVPNPENGVTKNHKRCVEVERFMQNLIEKWSVKSEYHFWLGQTINTFSEDKINQHFVNVKLKYRRFSNKKK